MARSILARLREYAIVELADLWALRQRRKIRKADDAVYLSAESHAFWMKKHYREEANRRPE